MRIEIKSTDRLGISQEILTIFSLHAWNVKAIEVITQYTYVHLERNSLHFAEIRSSLEGVAGIIHCREIELLPTESREKHLKTLLDRLPNPILDIDEQGLIIAANRVAEDLFPQNLIIRGKNITQFIDLDIKSLLVDKTCSLALEFINKSYIADISPVVNAGNISGAVIILRAMDSVGRQIAVMQSREKQGVTTIIGNSAKMRVLNQQTLRYGELELPVFISGETGTGKELIARALHNAGKRAKAPFLAINCSALPEHLLESELFGYASGAFTGAQKGGKPGLFELANGGTVFLDEIAEMSVYLQAKLLRFLQDFYYRRVGGITELHADVRIISATHQNIPQLLENKKFREDLFYRLNVLNLVLPPLRERREDISLLTKAFIENAAIQVNQPTPKISEQAMHVLENHLWPGNIRELQNVLFRVMALTQADIIGQRDILMALAQFDRNEDENVELYAKKGIEDWSSAQAVFEKDLLSQYYPQYPSTRSLAKRLNVSHNKIAMKLREHGIS
ncbi:MAG: transcriptional regulator of aroF, aroG, tyrA and aromatic amino acid transport [Alteromonadaceae bacterium]|jgi:transcriptional regulator of aroF, aroG, tyrA and aromatic amino acid transport